VGFVLEEAESRRLVTSIYHLVYVDFRKTIRCNYVFKVAKIQYFNIVNSDFDNDLSSLMA